MLLFYALRLLLQLLFLFLEVRLSLVTRRLRLRRLFFDVLELSLASIDARHATRWTLTTATVVEAMLRVGRLSLVWWRAWFAHRFWLWRLQWISLPLLRTLSRITAALQILLLRLREALRRL